MCIHIHTYAEHLYFFSHYMILCPFRQTILRVAMLDDYQIGLDVIDNFTIIINCSVLGFNKSHPLTINGTWGIGRITLAFYNLTINPTSCDRDTEAIPTITTILSVC